MKFPTLALIVLGVVILALPEHAWCDDRDYEHTHYHLLYKSPKLVILGTCKPERIYPKTDGLYNDDFTLLIVSAPCAGA